MPRFIDADELYILRSRSRRARRCRGDGALPSRHADGCPGVIPAMSRYVEYVGEVPVYQSGTPHCLACIRAFHPSATIPD